MAHGLHIDDDLGLIVARFWGRVDAEELDLVRCEIEQAPGFRPGLNRLWDERSCRIDVTTDELAELATRWEAKDHLHGERRLAYLVAHDVAWGFNRQFESFRDSDALGVDIGLFRDYAEALRWLDLPPDLPDPTELVPEADA